MYLHQNPNFDFEDYDMVSVISNCQQWASSAASVGSSRWIFGGQPVDIAFSFINMDGNNPPGNPHARLPFDSLESVLIHELGHNLGVVHANTLECDHPSIYELGCVEREYGNAFDVMGRGSYAFHFNAYFKDVLGWFNPSEILTIRQPGRYTINDLETTGGVKAAKILDPVSQEPLYYLEYRQAIGSDVALSIMNPPIFKNQSGLMINRASNQPLGASSSRPESFLLDMSPTASGSTWDDFLNVSLNPQYQITDPVQVFYDERSGITIRPIFDPILVRSGLTPSISFEVDIQTPGCVFQDPALLDSRSGPFYSNPGNLIYAGGDMGVNLKIQNADYLACPDALIESRVTPPTSWGLGSYVIRDNLPPEDYKWQYTEFSVPSNITPGTYVFDIEIENLNSGLMTVLQKNITVN